MEDLDKDQAHLIMEALEKDLAQLVEVLDKDQAHLVEASDKDQA